MTAPQVDPAHLVSVSRLLSKVLRHEPDLLGLRLDAGGWVDLGVLVSRLNRVARGPDPPKRLRSLPEISYEVVLQVVATNDKQRFALSDDGRRIRAVQGHSVPVALGHEVLMPPQVLFHGTAAKNWVRISREGLVPGSRHAVHLSADAETARRVGARHGRPIVLRIAAARMHEDGHVFTRAENGVWLVVTVPPEYLNTG